MPKIKIKRSKYPTIVYVARIPEAGLVVDQDFDGVDDGTEVAIYELIRVARVKTSTTLTDIVEVHREEIVDVTQPPRRRNRGR